MQIETKFHGQIEMDSQMIYQFPTGLPGFEEQHQFVILPIDGNDTFQVMQSTEEAGVAFVVANPYAFVPTYDLKIDEATVNSLAIEKEEDVFVLAVVSVKEPFEQSTLNLQAPLIFNRNNQKGKQMIVNQSTYSMRHPFQEEAK